MSEPVSSEVLVSPTITADQLFDFYVRNGICEANFGKEVAAVVLNHSSLVVGAFQAERLVGLARAMFDGLTASVMEFSLGLELQGPGNVYDNGSLVLNDLQGVGRRLGRIFIEELVKMGATFISGYAIEEEEPFYRTLGFERNAGHFAYFIDRRPYSAAGRSSK